MRKPFYVSAVATLLVLLSLPGAAAAPISGTASVIDGDTIEIHEERIRLDAIDAPESRQLCQSADGTSYLCGKQSAFALADLIGRSVVRCDPRGRDQYRRTIAVCYWREINLNAWMVSEGWAVAFRKHGKDYVSHEDDARLNRRGIWPGTFEMPWDWRARQR